MASRREKIVSMPGKHKYRTITPRPPDEVREAAEAAAAAMGSNLSAEIVSFMRWLGGLTDKEPVRPERP